MNNTSICSRIAQEGGIVVMRAYYVVLLFVAAISMIGCGEVQTQIVESSVQFNTDDTKGPYEVLTVVTSNQQPTVTLVYSTNNWNTEKTVEMAKVPSVGEDVYRGSIPGQPVGTTIWYYIKAGDQTGKQSTDPVVVPPASKGGVSYKFTILANP